MRSLITDVILYLFIRSLVFFITISVLIKDVKVVTRSDLIDIEDWFMFFWLFFVPPLIEVILLTFPFAYGLSRQSPRSKTLYYLFFVFLFLIEFLIHYGLIGIAYPFLKILISIFLFILIFRKRLSLISCPNPPDDTL
jgi:ABC-type spermidine/putrescine transport system permease subunit I